MTSNQVALQAGWYVCVAKPRQEHLAADNLRNQNFETFLPEMASWVRVAGRLQLRRQVMFPRYLFVRPTSCDQSIAPARFSIGVSHIVRFGTLLATLAADKVAALQGVCAEMASIRPDAPFARGTNVVFAQGPLKGATGIVSAVARERVTVMLSLLGHQHEVRVHAGELLAA